jgi:hypothetical protein
MDTVGHRMFVGEQNMYCWLIFVGFQFQNKNSHHRWDKHPFRNRIQTIFSTVKKIFLFKVRSSIATRKLWSNWLFLIFFWFFKSWWIGSKSRSGTWIGMHYNSGSIKAKRLRFTLWSQDKLNFGCRSVESVIKLYHSLYYILARSIPYLYL